MTDPVTVMLVGEVGHALSGRGSPLSRRQIRLVTSRADAEALNVVQREQPRLILIDTEPEARTASDLCENLKSLPVTNDIPVILLASGRVEPCRADQVIYKPLDRRALMTAVNRFLELPQRRYVRYPVNLRFSFKGADGGGQAFSRELALSGAFLKTDRRFAEDTVLEVGFRLPGDAREIRCRANVRYNIRRGSEHQVSGIGLEFEDLDRGDRERMARFLAQQEESGLQRL